MKIKTVVSILVLGICGLAVQQVQANLVLDESTSVTLKNNGVGAPSFTLTTVVDSGGPDGDYLYTYSLTGTVPLIGAFTVNGVGQNGFNTTGLNTFTETAGSLVNSIGFVSWTVGVSGPETFSFLSPYAPTAGNAFAQDGHQYFTAPSGSANSLVPIPDGGVTVALLGGAMTAMAFIRRKL